MDKLLTIFTPTYNRANTLVRLYDSLLAQTSDDFIWLIVDDGSTDNTEEIVKSWIVDNIIKIQYFKQSNQGKSMAHNKGVDLTKTELFVCVDSDDYLDVNAVEDIILKWKDAKKNNTGVLAFKCTEKDRVTSIKTKINESTLKDAYDIYGLKGDTMLVFKTSIINKYSFPHFENEKFVPEAYLYDLIDQEGKLLILQKYLYVCEYLEDGYTNNMARLLKNNPKGYFAYIKQRIQIDSKLKYKFFDYIRYVAMTKCVNYESVWNNKQDLIIKCLAYPFGILLYLKKFKKI